MIRYVLKTLGSLRPALAVGVGLPFLIGASAYAQAPTPATEATTERVIVTGSYIPTAETESALPVTVYTAEVLHKQGAQTPIEGLRQLPSFVGNTVTETDSNGGDGTAFINLRAIGPANTLTLINGRRAFTGLFADINVIPIGAISRTEVLKDGASAVYGSDAVAGVVNFILLNGPGEKPYEGAELFALYGNTTETDAHVRQVYLRGGVTGLDGKVSIAAVGEYYSRANLYARDRALSRTSDESNGPADPGYPGSGGTGLGGNNNNSNTFSGRVSVNASATQYPVRGALTLINSTDNQVTPASYRAFNAGHDPAQFNFLRFAPAIPAVEKALYYITGRYKIFGDGLQVYGDIMYAKSKQDNGLAASPLIITSAFNGLAESRASQFNPFGNDLTQLRYRFQQENSNRREHFDKEYHRYIAGLNGDFNIKDNGFISRFGYDAGFVYENGLEQEIDSGDDSRSRLRAQIAPVGFVNAVAPLPVAATGLFNPFIGINAPTIGNAPTYVNGVPTGLTAPYNNVLGSKNAAFLGHSEFYERDFLYDAKINAHLFPNLWNGGVDFAAGYEHRQVQVENVFDPVEATGDPIGFNAGANVSTRQEVDSVFLELGVPIVTSTMNVPFVRSFEVDFAWRYEKYTDRDLYALDPAKRTATFDNPNPNEDFGGSPRVTLRYQPVPDLTMRASWGQSFRAPTPNQLFSPVIQDFPVVFDPLKGIALQPPDGVWRGGNATLTPERTDAYTAGLVYTPKWLPGFTMTVDWYQLFTTDLIVSGNDFAQVLLTRGVIDPDGCGNNNGGVAQPGGPGLGITRFANGDLDCIDSGPGNAGKRFVQGMDVTATYEIPTERWGKFTFTGAWNHFFTWKAQPGTGAFNNFLGNYNNGTLPLAPGAIPWNKAFLRGEWEWHHFDYVATVNYTGDYRDDRIVTSTAADYVAVHGDVPRTVPSYITLDMQLSYEWVKPPTEPAPYVKESKDSKNAPVTEAATASIWMRMLWGTKLTVGVNDVFDRHPPSLLATTLNDNYDTSLYSERNRFWYVSLTKKF